LPDRTVVGDEHGSFDRRSLHALDQLIHPDRDDIDTDHRQPCGQRAAQIVFGDQQDDQIKGQDATS